MSEMGLQIPLERADAALSPCLGVRAATLAVVLADGALPDGRALGGRLARSLRSPQAGKDRRLAGNGAQEDACACA